MNEIIDAVKAPFDDTVVPPDSKTMALTWVVIGLLIGRAL